MSQAFDRISKWLFRGSGNVLKAKEATMKGMKGMGRTLLISITITIVSSVFGILFNMVNPNGIQFTERSPEQALYDVAAVANENNESSREVQRENPVAIPEDHVTENRNSGIAEQTSVGDAAASSAAATAEVEKDELPENSTDEISPGEIELISLSKAKEYFDRGEGFFVDARSEHSYYKRHIQGALSLSATRFDVQYSDFSGIMAKDALLIIYCQSITCPYSDIVARKLRDLGYTNIKVFAGGWAEWLQARYPVQGFKIYS